MVTAWRADSLVKLSSKIARGILRCADRVKLYGGMQGRQSNDPGGLRCSEAIAQENESSGLYRGSIRGLYGVQLSVFFSAGYLRFRLINCLNCLTIF